MAQKGIGRLIQIGLAKEASRGTAQPSASYWTPWSDLTLDEKKEFAIDDQSYGIIEDSTALTQTKKYAQGSIQGNVMDQSSPLLFLSLFGGYAHTTHAGETAVYDHAFTISENAQHQSLTFFLHDPLAAQDYAYANGVVEKLDLSIDLKKFISYNAAVKALSGAAQSTYSPSTTAENRFVPQYLSAKFANAYSTITGGGGTIVALRSVKLSFNANTEDQDVLGSSSPADFLNKEFSVEGSVEAIWKGEADFKAAFMGATPQAIRFDIKNTDVTIGSASNPEIVIDLPKCTFQELGRPFKVKDLIYQTVKFKAVYSVSDALMVKATVTNSVSSY